MSTGSAPGHRAQLLGHPEVAVPGVPAKHRDPADAQLRRAHLLQPSLRLQRSGRTIAVSAEHAVVPGGFQPAGQPLLGADLLEVGTSSAKVWMSTTTSACGMCCRATRCFLPATASAMITWETTGTASTTTGSPRCGQRALRWPTCWPPSPPAGRGAGRCRSSGGPSTC
jgi:hypothetical protein